MNRGGFKILYPFSIILKMNVGCTVSNSGHRVWFDVYHTGNKYIALLMEYIASVSRVWEQKKFSWNWPAWKHIQSIRQNNVETQPLTMFPSWPISGKLLLLSHTGNWCNIFHQKGYIFISGMIHINHTLCPEFGYRCIQHSFSGLYWKDTEFWNRHRYHYRQRLSHFGKSEHARPFHPDTWTKKTGRLPIRLYISEGE